MAFVTLALNFASLDFNSTLHKAHNFYEDANQPRTHSLRVFLLGRNERSCVVFQFLATVRTCVRIKEIAKLYTAMRAS